MKSSRFNHKAITKRWCWSVQSTHRRKQRLKRHPRRQRQHQNTPWHDMHLSQNIYTNVCTTQYPLNMNIHSTYTRIHICKGRGIQALCRTQAYHWQCQSGDCRWFDARSFIHARDTTRINSSLTSILMCEWVTLEHADRWFIFIRRVRYALPVKLMKRTDKLNFLQRIIIASLHNIDYYYRHFVLNLLFSYDFRETHIHTHRTSHQTQFPMHGHTQRRIDRDYRRRPMWRERATTLIDARCRAHRIVETHSHWCHDSNESHIFIVYLRLRSRMFHFIVA